MVKWGNTIQKHIEKSSFLFQKGDFVAYDSLKPSLKDDKGSGLQVSELERESLLGGNDRSGFVDLIDEEIIKVALTAEKRLQDLQEDLQSNAHESALVVSGVSDACWATESSENFMDQTANQRLVAATILGYIQVNAEALRKLGKKYDKCLALSLGTSQLEGYNDPRRRIEERIKVFLNRKIGPIINELNVINETLLEKERLIMKQRDNNTTSDDKEDLARVQELLAKLSGGKYDTDHILSAAGEADDYNDDSQDDALQGEEEGRKFTTTAVNIFTSYLQKQHLSIKWIVAMAGFCLIVGFQPVFADLTLRDAQYNEATVVLAEAVLSSLVGLVYVSFDKGWEGFWQVMSLSNVIFFAPTGVLRAVEDTLSILVLRYVDPLTYIVFSQLRLPLTVAAAHFFLEKKPSLLERQNVGVITMGLILYGLTDAGGSSSSGGRGGANQALGYVLLVIAVLCKVAASVYVDWAMKRRKHLTIPMQSANISMATIIPGVVFAFVIVSLDDTMSSGTLFNGWTPVLGVFVIYVLAKNWMSNTIIKHFSSTVKYIIYAAAMGVTYSFQLAMGFRTFEIALFACIGVVAYGVFLYSKSKNTIELIVASTIDTFVRDSQRDRDNSKGDGDEIQIMRGDKDGNDEEAVGKELDLDGDVDAGDVEMARSLPSEYVGPSLRKNRSFNALHHLKQ